MKEVGAAFLKFLIDDMCAKFSLESMCTLVRARLAQGPGTVDEIAQAIMGSDRSLDIVSARRLAEAAVETLAQSGDLVLDGASVQLAGATPRSGFVRAERITFGQR